MCVPTPTLRRSWLTPRKPPPSPTSMPSETWRRYGLHHCLPPTRSPTLYPCLVAHRGSALSPRRTWHHPRLHAPPLCGRVGGQGGTVHRSCREAPHGSALRDGVCLHTMEWPRPPGLGLPLILGGPHSHEPGLGGIGQWPPLRAQQHRGLLSYEPRRLRISQPVLHTCIVSRGGQPGQGPNHRLGPQT